MRVLVTGSQGRIGRAQADLLREHGHEVSTFDRGADHVGGGEHHPADLRDVFAVRRAVQGVDAVVHLGALASDGRGTPDDVLNINVMGTLNVLQACAEAGVGRVVNFSSINALGAVGGHRPPLYLPVDDAYPRHPMSPYQLSKHLGEEACRSYSLKHGVVTISLRPGWVTVPDDYAAFREGDPEAKAARMRNELWGYVDRDDVCRAALLALTVENVLNDAFLLFARDTTLPLPTAELAAKHWPDIPWKQDRDAYLRDEPFRSPFDCSHAREVLGWEPLRSWRDVAAGRNPE